MVLHRLHRRMLHLAGLLLLVWPFIAASIDAPHSPEREIIARQLAAMPAQRPGHPDLFVIGVAGDGRERVFSNEVEYLRTLAATHLDADGRMLALVNRPGRSGNESMPRATLDNLRLALTGIGQKMDLEQDLLLLYMASHGSGDHEFVLADNAGLNASITPQQLRQALDEAGIKHRILVVSACFSGGFIPALSDPDTLVLTAAAHDRSSFGCGAASTFTWFGRALLMEGFQHSQSPITAFQYARKVVKQLENRHDYPASHPQIEIGANIREHIAHWLAHLPEIPEPPELADTGEVPR